MKFVRALQSFFADFTLDSTCPICGFACYIKTMPLHLSGHNPDDPDVVAWREAGAPKAFR